MADDKTPPKPSDPGEIGTVVIKKSPAPPEPRPKADPGELRTVRLREAEAPARRP